MKYKNRLAGKIAEQEEFAEEQKKLRNKYAIKEEGIIRIEKKRKIEILLDQIIALRRLSFGIVEIILATIGAISLLYPDTRTVLYMLSLDLINQAWGLMKG